MAVRVALIGCGKITQRLALPQLTACRHAQIVALVDRNRAQAVAVAKQFHIDRRQVWTDWRQMLRQVEVDAVGVCLPNDLHAEVTVACLRAGAHVLVEKPIAMSLAQADAMMRAARRFRRLLMVEQTQRFDPIHETTHALLRRRVIGPITHVRGRLGHAGPEYWSRTSPWFTQKRHSGGGALMDIGIHLIDLLRWLSGREVARLCCQTKTGRRGVEDHAGLLLEWADGTTGSCEVSWATRPYEVATDWYGTRGTLHTRLDSRHPVTVDWSHPDGRPKPVAERLRYPRVSTQSRWGGAYPYFVQCIRTGKKPFVSGEEGRNSLAVVLAAYESAKMGRWVTLPLRA